MRKRDVQKVRNVGIFAVTSRSSKMQVVFVSNYCDKKESKIVSSTVAQE